jgi:lactoylglutathione lyase
MKIEHMAVWTKNLEEMKQFYVEFFGGVAKQKYFNSSRNFESYFIAFSSGARLELMRLTDISEREEKIYAGFAHIAFSIGSKENVDEFTARLKNAGYPVVSGPRTTGDGYYESCILDPDGNPIEITQ